MNLHDIQSKVHVAKDKRNDFGGYNYRTAEGILAAAKAALPEGATIVVTDEIREVAGQIFVEAKACITLADGASHEAKGFALHPLTKKGMDPSQITGSASSYARKYALSGLLALDDGSVDPDSAKEPYQPDTEAQQTDSRRNSGEPSFPHRKRADEILGWIEDCKTQQHLRDVWLQNSAALKRIEADKPPMFAELVTAKDKAKARLTDDVARQAPPMDEGRAA